MIASYCWDMFSYTSILGHVQFFIICHDNVMSQDIKVIYKVLSKRNLLLGAWIRHETRLFKPHLNIFMQYMYRTKTAKNMFCVTWRCIQEKQCDSENGHKLGKQQTCVEHVKYTCSSHLMLSLSLSYPTFHNQISESHETNSNWLPWALDGHLIHQSKEWRIKW
jgi:hypothetical protein